MIRISKLALAASAANLVLISGLLSEPAVAITPYEIKDMNGNPFITLRVFNVGDGEYGYDHGAYTSTWNLPVWQIEQIKAATGYWGQLIQAAPGNNPAVINVGTFEGTAAAALSWNAIQAFGSPSAVEAAIINQPTGEMKFGSHGFVLVGHFDWSTLPYTPSQLALDGATSLDTVLIHEVAHALGVMANAHAEFDSEKEEINAKFTAELSAWSAHLRDDNDKASAPGQIIWCAICEKPNDGADIFDVRQDKAYFSGDNVTEVLNGAMKGLPMRVKTDYGPVDSPLFSHIELKNGLMSHQYYRNYNTLMEAEIAALQDIGFTIDRRNFYGYSVYNDGLTLINDNPFFSRNAEGTAYIPDTYNTATLGVGLHIYGSNNNITQRADLLSAGAGGAGIRIDGASNDLTILPETRVHANGANGRAVMFAYGKDHTLTQRGDVQALGQNGVAVSFDFGHNSRGDATGYRGSYIPWDSEKFEATYQELHGPLVSTFDLTGRIAGSKAAIFMSKSGYAQNINVMRGASISGDIISDYYEFDENDELRLTDLTFGLKPDDQGHSTNDIDPDFNITYGDNIKGDNISLQFFGGTSTLTGNHDLYEVVVDRDATLRGSGSYIIGYDRYFNNYGTLVPSVIGQAITINGHYLQTENGVLQLAFNDEKQISSLVVNGRAELDGTIAFAPVQGWYGDGFTLTSNKWLAAESYIGAFANVTTTLSSPTLTAKATDNGDQSYTVSLTRNANAYSRFANSANARGVGAALDGIAGNAAPGLRNLISALDFSAADGSTIRAALPQLSGEAYASANGVLVNDSGAIRASVNSRLAQAFGGTPANPVSVLAFGPEEKAKTTPASAAIDQIATSAIPPEDLSRYAAWGSVFGLWTSQSDDGNAARTKSTLGGFVSGIDASVYENWRLGVMAGYSRSTFKTGERNSSGSSDNYTIGAYTGTEWDTANGAIGFRSGLAYSWHNVEMSRSVAFNGFSDNLSGDYNAGTFQAFGELGYKYKVTERSVLEPYANLAYVHVNTDSFTEQGLNGAALSLQSGSMDTGLSTLGLRASTNFNLGNTTATARADLGWRHAFGDVIPTSTASFAAGSGAFTAAGNAIGKNTALIETGLDFAVTQNATLGIAYQGQFGSGITQNGLNANFSMKF